MAELYVEFGLSAAANKTSVKKEIRTAPSSRSSTIGSKQAAEALRCFNFGTFDRRLFTRFDQLVCQSLMRSLGVIVCKILIDCVSQRLFAEQNQAIETLGF